MDAKNVKIRPAIEALEVGGEITFPLEKLRNVRVTASDLGLILGRVYTTNANREERVVRVVRTA